MTSNTPQNFLYHYTEKATEQLITANRTIRAYELFSMEDTTEFNFGVNLFCELVRLRGVEKKFEKVISFIQNEIYRKPEMLLFVLSLTDKSSSQKHYRDYGKNNGPLQIDTNKLAFKATPGFLRPGQPANIFHISKVQYDKKNQTDHFLDLIDHYLSLYDEILFNHTHPATRNHMGMLGLGAFQCVVELSALFKQKKYNWEDEWRTLVLFTKGMPLVHTYTCGKTRKYVELTF